jgi:hypothetical protein
MSLDLVIFALAGAIILGAGAVALRGKRDARRERIAFYVMVAVLAAVMIAGFYSLALPCESDKFRRCDLDGPNAFPKGCGLTVKPYRPC